MEKTYTELYEFCKAHYFTDSGDLWEPFENYPQEEVYTMISNDVDALKQFLKDGA